MNDHDAAIASFDQALAGTADASDQQLLEAAATSLSASREDLYTRVSGVRARRDRGAAQWYERATLADPNWSLPLFKLVLALKTGDMDRAREYFQRVVEVNDPRPAPASIPAVFRRARRPYGVGQ